MLVVLWLSLVPGVGSHLSFFPWLSLIGMVGVLVESGRVPGDLSEAESELVSGYNLEFGGFLYALLASGEYAGMLFNAMVWGWLFLGAWMSSGMVCMSLTICCVFVCFLVVRSTLPRIRWWDLLWGMWSGLWCVLLGWIGLCLGVAMLFSC